MKKIIFVFFVLSSVFFAQTISDIDIQLDRLLKESKDRKHNSFSPTEDIKFNLENVYGKGFDKDKGKDSTKFTIGNTEFNFVEDQTYRIFIVTEDKTTSISSPEEMLHILRIDKGTSIDLKFSQIVRLSKDDKEGFQRLRRIVFEMIKGKSLTNKLQF